MMPNFKFILIDNMDYSNKLPKIEYATLKKDLKALYPGLTEEQYNNKLADILECFDSAYRVTSITAAVLLSFIYIL